MRVSDGLFYNRASASIQRSQKTLIEAQERALTERRVTKPSDDPVATALAHREKSREADAEVHQRTIDTGLSTLSRADGALEHVSEGIQRIRELTVMASSEPRSAQDRLAIANEVTEIQRNILGLANSEFDGRYLFAGFQDDQPPFDGAGDYQSDGNVRELEVAPGVLIRGGISGEEVFTAAAGADVFDEIENLRQALITNDETAIRATLDPLDTAYRQVVHARSVVGGRMEAFEVAEKVTEGNRQAAIVEQTKLLGIEPSQAYLELERARHALEVAIQIASFLPPPGLAQR